MSTKPAIVSSHHTPCICLCKNVAYDAIENSIHNGCKTVEEIKEATGASVVCGSCIPRIEQILSDPRMRVASPWEHLILLFLAFISLLALLTFFMTPAVEPHTIFSQSWWAASTALARQLSGFLLTALMLMMMTLSLKRLFPYKIALSFQTHRMIHIMLGNLLPLILLFHTAAHSGENFNALLFSFFILSLITGFMATLVTALALYLPRTVFSSGKKWLLRLHLSVLSLLPLLIGLHIFRVYFF